MIVGIDPGVDGAIALIGSDGQIPLTYLVPTQTFKRGKGRKREYDDVAMADLLWGFHDAISLVVLEKSQAMPKQGVSSTLSIGVGYGLWRGIIADQKLRSIRVRPLDWHKALTKGLAGDPKERAWRYISGRFPGLDLRATDKCRKPHTGIIDALCLACYGQMQTAGGCTCEQE